jgi:hypothetical protein
MWHGNRFGWGGWRGGWGLGNWGYGGWGFPMYQRSFWPWWGYGNRFPYYW